MAQREVTSKADGTTLTHAERALVDHVSRGERLDFAREEPVDQEAMRSWDTSRTIRASVLRDILRGRLVRDPDPHGLRLRGARITGRLDLEYLTSSIIVELIDCFLDEGLTARSARLPLLSVEGSLLEHRSEPALYAARFTASALFLDRATITASCENGAVRVAGAHLGQLDIYDAVLRNKRGPALSAEGVQVEDVLYLNGLDAMGTGPDGAVILANSRLGGLNCYKATFRGEYGPALNAHGLQIDHDADLRGFTATGGDLGAVRLTGAHIGGSLECDGAELRNDSGPALYADRLQVDQSIFLRYGFTATGSSGYGVVYLIGAHIGGHLDCTKADLRNDSGPALAAYSLEVGQGMYLGGGLTATGGGKGVAVDLTDARVSGKFVFAPARLEHRVDSHQRLAVDGLTYAGVPDTGLAEGWLELLQGGTPGYAAQPYQQLAAGYRARGDDRQARQTLIAQRDDQLARAPTRRGDWLWGRITKVTLGYGYQPWRALLFLAAVVAVSCTLAVVLGSHGALAQTSNTATPGRSCTVVQQVSVGLDLNLPVGTSVARADCDLTMDSAVATAAWLSAVSWVLRLLAWAFAVLFIAGFTSAVRKT
jgi:uncharacterized protein YjbI with pentapeptide repeats